ncbi:TraR/DksA C4-type zinc finger protein [Pseudomonas sp. Ga0074129]|uniref:TraR/DksA C4-type zinc finger protein n=1 Tax=Pseudomonas sp. Ga0074129 TaxID=1752219 RepID=UPI000B295CF0|nr:TraR/DksA C4-type zinc finger protein [Pseudomonas sp. Ga0074129]
MDENQFERAQELEEQQRVAAMANRVQYQGVSALECVECGSDIPDARRVAVPGCQCCIDRQQLRELKRG